jgi:hypothetical protein
VKKIQTVYLADDGITQAPEIDLKNLLSVVFTAGSHNFIVVLEDDGISIRSTTHELTIKPVAQNMVVIK